jgi:hypothetical protein
MMQEHRQQVAMRVDVEDSWTSANTFLVEMF